MNTNYMALNGAIDCAVTDITKRARIIAIALAVALSKKAHLPTERVDNVMAFFDQNVMPDLAPILSSFNEEIIVDCAIVKETLQAMWMVRYNAAFPARLGSYIPGYDFFCCSNGVATHVTPDTFKFANENATAIFCVIAAIFDLPAFCEGN